MNHEEFSRKGGQAGTGEKKRRGDSEYYRSLRKRVGGNSAQRRVHKRKAARVQARKGAA